MSDIQPVDSSDFKVSSMLDIEAKIDCRDTSYVMLSRDETTDSWRVLSVTNLYIPLHNRSAISALLHFIKNVIECGYDEMHKYRLVDIANGRPSQLSDNPQTVQFLAVKHFSSFSDESSYIFTFFFCGSMQYTPFDRSEHTDAVHWFKHCAQLIVDRMVRELMTQAHINSADIHNSSKFINLNDSICKHAYKTHTVYRSKDGLRIDVKASLWEQPDLWVDKVNITFDVDDWAQANRIATAPECSCVIHLHGHEVHFINAHNCKFGDNAVQYKQIVDFMALGRHNYLEDDDSLHAYFMSVDESANFAKCIRQELMEAILKNGTDELCKHTDHLIVQIAEQLKQHFAIY